MDVDGCAAAAGAADEAAAFPVFLGAAWAAAGAADEDAAGASACSDPSRIRRSISRVLVCPTVHAVRDLDSLAYVVAHCFSHASKLG